MNGSGFLLLARIAGWIVFLSTIGRLMPLKAMLRFVDTRKRLPDRARMTPQQLAALVDRVSRSCWKRAAVLRRYLLMNGVESTIVFGVRKGSAGPIDGHAWLERDGEPFLEAETPRHVVTYRYPA